jgi:two-component system LytT family response regulator
MSAPAPVAPLRTMLVDDESLARQRLRRLLGAHDDVTIVGEAADVPTARGVLASVKPTLLFLDVSMPGEDGFALLADLPPELRPFVVFVTAHADAAVRAFEARATDFLVKPVAPPRLAESLARAREAIAARAPAATGFDDEVRAMLARILGERAAGGDALRHFAVTVGRKTRFVKPEAVDWFHAEGNYVRLHAGREQHLVRMTMQKLEASLDPVRFVRIHRSIIVQLDRVRELEMVQPGEYRVVLADGTALEVMRTYRDRLPLG